MGLKFVGEGICSKRCPDQGTYFDISIQMCRSCELFEPKDMKLHPVVVRVPELPYLTSYPFPIRYSSKDANLLCVTFEIEERVVGSNVVKTIPVSNLEQSTHHLPAKPGMMPDKGAIKYRVIMRLNDLKSNSNPVYICSPHVELKPRMFNGYVKKVLKGDNFVLSIRRTILQRSFTT